MADKIKPTPERERQAHAGSVDKVEVLDDKHKRVIVDAPRKFTSHLETLERSGAISKQEMDAGEKYFNDWRVALQPSSMIPGYREYTDPTTGGAQDAAARRSDHYTRFTQATKYMGDSLQDTVNWLILEVPLPGENRPPTLAEVGLAISHYKQKEAARAFAVSRLKVALERLVEFYKI